MAEAGLSPTRHPLPSRLVSGVLRAPGGGPCSAQPIGVAQLIGAPGPSGPSMQSWSGSACAGWQWLFCSRHPSVNQSVLGGLAILPQRAKNPVLTAEERDLWSSESEQDHAHKQGLAGKAQPFRRVQRCRVWALGGGLLRACHVLLRGGILGFRTIIHELARQESSAQFRLIAGFPWGASIGTMIYWGEPLGSHPGTQMALRGGHAVHYDRAHSAAVRTVHLCVDCRAYAHYRGMGGLRSDASGRLPTAFLSGTAAAAGIALSTRWAISAATSPGT